MITYFGTDLNEHGHYHWQLVSENTMQKIYPDRLIPFNPEELTKHLPKGEVIYYQGGDYTVLGIAGSCKDERPGSESIFWVKEKLSFEQMKEKILSIPIANKIIGAMKFKVNW